MHRVGDRDEVHRANDGVRPHRVDDVLRVGSRARVVVDLGSDRVAHPAAQPFAHDGRVADVDVRRLGCAVEIAGLGKLERPAHQIDRRRILEGQVVHVVGDHEEARITAPRGMVEPQEQHPRRQRERALLSVRLVLAFGVAVRIGDREKPGVVLGGIVQRGRGPLRVLVGQPRAGSEPRGNGAKPVSRTCRDTNPRFSSVEARDLRRARPARPEKKSRPPWGGGQDSRVFGAPDLRPQTSDHRETVIRTVARNDDHLLLSAC